ncbi:MAG: hypothetical protein ACX94C_06775 [Phycisphaerales bacterium]
MQIIHHFRPASILTAIAWLAVALTPHEAVAQNSAHPEAKPPIPENPYISYRDPWRWDLRAQLFLNSVNIFSDNPSTPGRDYDDEVITTKWWPHKVELVYPVVRNGGFYWSPNEEVEVSLRLDDVDIYNMFSGTGWRVSSVPDQPISASDIPISQKYVKGTNAEYSHWQSGEISGEYRQLYLKHLSHIVVADTVFNDKLARKLPWPEKWDPEAEMFLTPVVDSVGEPVPADAEETIDKLVKHWIGEDTNPRDGGQLDVVKFLTGKVIEYFTIRGQATEFTNRTTAGGRPSFVVSSNTWGGFIVRPADQVALDPNGSRHELAVLLTSVLRSAGVPARTVVCIDEEIEDPLLSTVSLVEFAMHDPERDLTFWVPIDVDRVRLSGARSSQFQRTWLYFGTNDELNHIIPIAYYFHPPARYKAYDLPLLYGIRSASDKTGLPQYMIQALLIEPIPTPVTGNE